MSNTLMFVCSDAEKCATLAAPLVDAGWEIETIDPGDSNALESIEAESPVATVFDLETGPDQAIHELAKAMLGDPDLPRPLLVFVGGKRRDRREHQGRHPVRGVRSSRRARLGAQAPHLQGLTPRKRRISGSRSCCRMALAVLPRLCDGLRSLRTRETKGPHLMTQSSPEFFAAACNLIPGGVNSPVRAFKSVGIDPRFFDRAKGTHIWDVDGNEYVDFVASWGPMILGHAPEPVLDAVREQLERGHELRRADLRRGRDWPRRSSRPCPASRWCASSRAAPRRP